jgi:seryl-tRNA(Sec) selenium transferase
LRQLKTSIIARIEKDQAIFDLKTVSERHLDKLADSINKFT